MTTSIVLAAAMLVGLASTADAQVNARNLVGSYLVTGTELDGSPYDTGTVDVSLAPSGALEFRWDGGKYVGVGQVVGDGLAVASSSENRAVILIMSVNPDGSLTGKWWRRTDPGAKGTEVWKRKK